MNSIEFKYGNELKLDEVIELYTASTLGERRPIDDRRIMSDMIRYANLTVTAWDGELLVGIASQMPERAPEQPETSPPERAEGGNRSSARPSLARRRSPRLR